MVQIIQSIVPTIYYWYTDKNADINSHNYNIVEVR